MSNSGLNKARLVRNDDFRTQFADARSELALYRAPLTGKTVLCNCDDFQSNIGIFLKRFARPLGIKKLILLSYSPYRHAVREDIEYDHENETLTRALTSLEGDGDFSSDECKAILDECDVVVTNPPFSRFEEFLLTVVDHRKDFILIGNKNAITYKGVFPLFMEGKLYLGNRSFNSDMWFKVESQYAEKFKGSVPLRHVMACWYTSFDMDFERPKVRPHCRYDPEKYPHYDEIDAINVDKVNDIPRDWFGMMGVPISYLAYHDPERYEIIGHAGSSAPSEYSLASELHIGGRNVYKRLIIRRKELVYKV